MRRNTWCAVCMGCMMWAMSPGSAAAFTATWDGGNGNWTDFKWNGGLPAFIVFGRENGVRAGDGLADEFVIGGGSNVLYLAGPSGIGSDFVLNSGGGATRGIIQDGATLELRTEEEPDGLWTEWDGDLVLDNGTLKRTFQQGGTALTSGAMMWGSWNTEDLTDHEINIELTHGGRFENHGMLMFGAWNEHGPGLKVSVTIHDGFIDLTGGNTFVLNDELEQNAELHFYYGTEITDVPKDESYAINFTGPGSITLDEAGIRIHRIGAGYSSWDHEAKTYQDLWDLGILQANGLSGLDGANFGEYFTVTGSSGAPDYTLTSRVTGGVTGDFNGDGTWNCADVDALVAEIAGGTNDTAFDMNGDGLVNTNDLYDAQTGWLAVGGANNAAATGGNPFLAGDANLDGVVDVTDFNVWNGSKFTSVAAWCSGDFTADGAVDVSDFNVWNGTKFTSSSGLVAVPEPSLGIALAAALAGLGLLRRKPSGGSGTEQAVR